MFSSLKDSISLRIQTEIDFKGNFVLQIEYPFLSWRLAAIKLSIVVHGFLLTEALCGKFCANSIMIFLTTAQRAEATFPFSAHYFCSKILLVDYSPLL